jgi:Transposase, Mutator family
LNAVCFIYDVSEITGPGGLLSQLAGRVIETALGAELSDHLGYPPGQAPTGGAGNVRNGSTAKTVQTELGPVDVKTPRDRHGTFEPQLVAKRQTRLAGLDEKILDLGSITKAGSARARRLLVESAWNGRRRPTVGYELARRQRGQDPGSSSMRGAANNDCIDGGQGWQAMVNPTRRSSWHAHGKLAGFVWAIAAEQPLKTS